LKLMMRIRLLSGNLMVIVTGATKLLKPYNNHTPDTALITASLNSIQAL
jgi:hypothetical protein